MSWEKALFMIVMEVAEAGNYEVKTPNALGRLRAHGFLVVLGLCVAGFMGCHPDLAGDAADGERASRRGLRSAAGKVPWELYTKARPRVLFSCTTYLARRGKLEQLIRALDSLQTQHSAKDFAAVERFLVINEYSDQPTPEAEEEIRTRFPWVEFIQKGPEKRGQAHSLNMILDEVKKVDVWIHWEESWECLRPFIADAVRVLIASDLVQLQLWADQGRDLSRVEPRQIAEDRVPFAELSPHPGFLRLEPSLGLDNLRQMWGRYGTSEIWPPYSLRPSVNRAAFYAELGAFSTDPALWPWLFEWEYGMRCFRAGITTGILMPDAADRLPGHVSTCEREE